jgi:hypothetical protein
MMFTWLNTQGVKSDKGFVVQSMSRFVIKYSESMGEIDLSVEYGKKVVSTLYTYTTKNFINGMMDARYQRRIKLKF